ncbi:MAG: FAD-dependent oxidoreductase [Candidatus Omnitrophica bacterium]|nr:FAD-dependent oxidoreductase [Candidatus Omnitrophota bacterium]
MTHDNHKKRVVVLGSGVSGLAAAYAVSRKGFDCTVIEKSDFSGGLAASFLHNDYSLDYGPHNLHTRIPWMVSFIEKDLGIPLKRMRSRPAKILFHDKIVDYPINIFESLKKINLLVAFKCFVYYVYARMRLKVSKNISDDSFEDWVTNRFGRYLFDIYFGHYVKKVWGVPASELDAVIARKRLPDPSFMALALRAIFGVRTGKKHSEDPKFTRSYYPSGGIGAIPDKFAEYIKGRGGRIELGSKIEKIIYGGLRGNIVHYESNGRKNAVECDLLINTIPLDQFIALLDAPGSDKIAADKPFFLYRGTVFLYLFLNIKRVTEHPWIYFNEKDNRDLIFNRMYEISNFTHEPYHDRDGVLCLEITCYKNDHTWKMSDNALFEKCISFLEKKKILKRENVKEVMARRVDTVYPVFKKYYMRHLESVLGYLEGLGNIITIGRQGLFSYTNVDECIDMGLRVERLIQGDSFNTKDFRDIYRDYTTI